MTNGDKEYFMFGLFGSKKKKQPQFEHVTDDVLGEIYYDAPSWLGDMGFKLFGKTYNIEFKMDSENKEPVTAAQKESYKKIINNDTIVGEVEKVLRAQFPEEEFGCPVYEPMSLHFRPNGDCALIVYIGEEGGEDFGFAVNILPEVSFFGDEESYWSMVCFWDT